MSIPNLQLSPDQIDDWKKIAEIDRSDLKSLFDKFDRLKPPVIAASDLLKTAQEVIKNVDHSTSLVREVLSLRSLERSISDTAGSIVDGVIHFLSSENMKSNVVEQLGERRSDILAIMATESVKLCSKALSLGLKHDNLYVSGNTITDIRPVFDSGRKNICGGVVVQTLRLEYLRAGDRCIVSLAVDINDIKSLQKKLQSAVDKAEASKKIFSDKIQLPIFLVGEETYGF